MKKTKIDGLHKFNLIDKGNYHVSTLGHEITFVPNQVVMMSMSGYNEKEEIVDTYVPIIINKVLIDSDSGFPPTYDITIIHMSNNKELPPIFREMRNVPVFRYASHTKDSDKMDISSDLAHALMETIFIYGDTAIVSKLMVKNSKDDEYILLRDLANKYLAK